MKWYTARKDKICKKLELFVNGKKDKTAFAFSLDGRCYKRYVLNTETGKVKVHNRELVTEIVYDPYEVRYRGTGVLFGRSR